MPYIVVGFVLYLLYRHYAQQAAPAPLGSQSNPANADSGPGDQPANGGGGDVPAPVSPPAVPTVSWQVIPEGQQLTPGADYRASAPPQGMLVMALIPGHMASVGFTNVVIHKPGESFPNDWPDTGDALRIEATLPPGAQAQTLSLDGVSVWRKVITQTAGDVARHVARRAVQMVEAARGGAYPNVPYPTSNGVYAGLVRPPQSR